MQMYVDDCLACHIYSCLHFGDFISARCCSWLVDLGETPPSQKPAQRYRPLWSLTMAGVLTRVSEFSFESPICMVLYRAPCLSEACYPEISSAVYDIQLGGGESSALPCVL